MLLHRFYSFRRLNNETKKLRVRVHLKLELGRLKSLEARIKVAIFKKLVSLQFHQIHFDERWGQFNKKSQITSR